jgi:molybdate transport system regulatory protein
MGVTKRSTTGTPRPPQRARPAAVHVRVKAWVRWPDGAEVGPGRLALLKSIDHHGSISLAARSLGISYRAAWNWIQAMNDAAARPLVVARPGGTKGGGAVLTPTGRAVIDALDALAGRVARLAADATAEFQALLAGAAGAAVSHRKAPPPRTRRRTSRT